MSAPRRSSIAWTDYSGGDANFVCGCTPVSEGCRACYAKAIYERFGRDFSNVQADEDKLGRLESWIPKPPWKRMDSTRPWIGRPMCFVCDTGDLFHPDVPNDFIASALDVMASRDDVDWQVLTKRPERFHDVLWFMDDCWLGDSAYNVTREVIGPPPNIWLGVSVENQARADERIPLLLQVPAAVRFLSVEPMLEPIDLNPWLPKLDWVICGGESGPRRRAFDVTWALHLEAQCRGAGIPFLYKQGSALKPGQDNELPGRGIVQEWPREKGAE